jgi:hypothetical protein
MAAHCMSHTPPEQSVVQGAVAQTSEQRPPEQEQVPASQGIATNAPASPGKGTCGPPFGPTPAPEPLQPSARIRASWQQKPLMPRRWWIETFVLATLPIWVGATRTQRQRGGRRILVAAGLLRPPLRWSGFWSWGVSSLGGQVGAGDHRAIRARRGLVDALEPAFAPEPVDAPRTEPSLQVWYRRRRKLLQG